ncbi:MAG TPA: hypothetical protein VFR94_10310 [Nitrososphaeraceae archaeon]|nr:hypothetical protein [Nitrososphaeraceae archaeon]
MQNFVNSFGSISVSIPVQEIHRHVNRLLKAGLIQKNSANSYSLTAFGTAMLTQIPTLSFLSKNKSYFLAHTFGALPLKFLQRLGYLADSQYLDNQVSIFEYQRDLLSKAQNYLYIILQQKPLLRLQTGLYERLSMNHHWRTLQIKRMVSWIFP